MNINLFKKLGIFTICFLGLIYILFLILPFIISPFLNRYLPLVSEEIAKCSGLNSKIENVRIVTTPKLSIGANLGSLKILTPNNKEVFKIEDFAIRMSLIPLLTKKIELDLVQIGNVDAELGFNKDGSLEIEKFFPKVEIEERDSDNYKKQEAFSLPFGLKLSNSLPDIKIGNYDIEIVDLLTSKKYELEGDKLQVTDFVLDKGFKFSTNGKAKLVDREQFTYDVKINNKIMPDLNLHELVFQTETDVEKSESLSSNINVLEIFEGIYNNKITANIETDLILAESGNKGYVKANNLSIINLPASNINMDFKGHKIYVDSAIYTASDEISTLTGNVQIGNKANLDLRFKSAAKLNNIFRILNAFATVFNVKDLQTLTAKGNIDADFNIKSNLKNIVSNGYFRIPNADIYYGLYNIGIDDINADIALANNNIEIKNIGFSIFNQPLRVFGNISSDAYADVHLLAENLSLKGLLIACGQAPLLKENPVSSGVVSLKADIVGKLDKIKPTANISLGNFVIKNVPSNTTLKLSRANINVVSDGRTVVGSAISENFQILNPAAGVSIPKLTANIKENEIEITETPISVEKIKFNISGKIKNYMTEKIGLDFKTTGDIKAKLIGDVNLGKQTLNLNFATVENSTIIVPMFDKSSLTFNGNINVIGNILNPILSGTVNVPTLSIPEIPVVMENLVAKLNGPILRGHATLSKFASGGIVAENCSTDFSLKGADFYLNNLKGQAFAGKVWGNIIYNLSTLNTKIDFHGSSMDAEKAVKGAVGISNALTGTLGFDTKLVLKVIDYEGMMRSMRGKLSFKVLDGSFGNIGRLENFFNAGNIVGNTLLKTTVATLSNLSGIKNTAKYDYIVGEMTFDNGWANISSIKSTGKSLAYYVYGKMHLINMSTNLTILGRLDQEVVNLLGPIGELSADKLLSAIPKFGSLTATIVNTLTADPKIEKISEIPTLSNNSKNYKDFKVVFNGGIDSTNSIKSFKWLTRVDTSALEPKQDVVETIKSLKTTVGSDLNNMIDTVKTQRDVLKGTANELKSLFKF